MRIRKRIGALNVQGFTETLKLKFCILFMQEYKDDILLLSETKSRQHYSCQSWSFCQATIREVDAIILADVVQVNRELST